MDSLKPVGYGVKNGPEDDRLWELPRGESGNDGPVPADAELRQYRRGALGPERTRRIEDELGHSAAARDRLVELAGVRPAPAGVPTS